MIIEGSWKLYRPVNFLCGAETSLPPLAVNAIIAGIVGFNVLTALNPSSPTFSSSNQQDVKKRPK